MDPNNLIKLTVSIIYYIVTAVLTLLSVFAVYILLRYGKNRSLNLILSVLYCLFFLTLVAQSYYSLQGIS